jgi:hypothetical protein
LSQTASKDIINKFELAASSIIVYDREANGGNVIFKAESSKDENGDYKKGGAVYLAGWTVTSKQLTTGTIGDADSFGIYPTGIVSEVLHDNFSFKNKLPTDGKWVMTAGQNFGLTENGVLYANAGKIGDITIGDIASKDDVTVGRNLAIRSAISP